MSNEIKSPEQESIEPYQRRFLVVLLMLILFSLFVIQLLGFGWNNASNQQQTTLLVSIRASSQADYSKDTDAPLVPPVNENIFSQIIQDLQGTGSPSERASTLQVSLSMPVPTMTVNPQMPTSTNGPAASKTPPATSMGQITGTAQATGTSQVTSTSTLPAATPTPASTQVVPTSTPTGSNPTPVPPVTKNPRPTQKPKPTQKPTKTPKP